MLIYQHMDNISSHLGSNIVNLRKLKGLSQAQLAKVAQIPRSTLTYTESGEGNPTLSNILKISRALNVSVEELISAPMEEFRIIKSFDIPIKEQKNGSVMIQKLLPDPIAGMEIDKITLEPLSRMKGSPHIKNTKEYFYCIKGEFEIYINKQVYIVKQGDLFRFPGDRAHAYVNPHKNKKAEGFSVVAFSSTK